jgi:hypothetical protein
LAQHGVRLGIHDSMGIVHFFGHTGACRWHLGRDL